MRLVSSLVCVFAIAAGCRQTDERPDGILRVEPRRPLRAPVEATDADPVGDVVDVTLNAQVAEVELLPGKRTAMWTYGGTVPGPLIRAKQGDLVVVRFKNDLPEPTTIHWHGLRIPAEMDGVAAMTSPVPPGATFEYRFRVPDAGLFWYHPHVRSDVQTERGLYGAILVEAQQEPVTARERVLVLDDVLLGEDGALAPPVGGRETMIGRQGNLLLVNGQAMPVVGVASGERERWRIVNAATARYFLLSLPGHAFYLLGTDGGLLERPIKKGEILLAPGERVDVVVFLSDEPGAVVDLVTSPYDRGHQTATGAPVSLVRVQYKDAPGVQAAPLPNTLRALPPRGSPARTQRIVFSEAAAGAHAAHPAGAATAEPVFLVNGAAFPHVPPLRAALGTTEVWEVRNESPMDHPFHLHGFAFEVLSVDAVEVVPRAVKDTINLRAGTTTRLLVSFDGHAGSWMYHCHILEHAERGMAGVVEVAAAGEAPGEHGGH